MVVGPDSLPKKEFDFIVLGAGSGGCAVAANLARLNPTASVALFEAGPKDNSPFIQNPAFCAAVLPHDFPPAFRFNWGFEGEPSETMAFKKNYFPRGRGMGGSSSINAMLYIRGHPSDYDDWALWTGNQKWNYQNVLKIFKSFEKNLRGPSDAHGDSGSLQVTDGCQKTLELPIWKAFSESCAQLGYPATSDFNGLAGTEGIGAYQHSITEEGYRCNAATAFVYPALEDCPNLTVATNTACTRILFEGGRAVGVRVSELSDKGKLSQNPKDIALGGGEVVVALGALQTPQLLMLSGVGDARHLRSVGVEGDVVVDNPNVGLNLQDHLDVILNARIGNYTPTKSFSLKNASFLWNEFNRYKSNGSGVFRTIVELGGFLKSDPSLPRPDIQLHYIPAILTNHARDKHFRDGYSLHACQLYPTSRGSVTLRSASPTDHPVIKPNFLSTEYDQKVLSKAYDIVYDIITGGPYQQFSPAIQGPPSSAPFEEKLDQIRKTGDSIYHPVGTCKMGKSDDPTSVVDPELRLLGVQGVRIADASVYPNLIGGNTNAPTMMIGCQAALFMSRDA